MPRFNLPLFSSPLGLFLIGIAIPFGGAFLVLLALQAIPTLGAIALFTFAVLVLIVLLSIALIAIYIARIRDAEHALRHSNNELSVILSSIGEGLLVLDADERVILLNPAAEHMLGFQLDHAAHPHIASVVTFFKESEMLEPHLAPPIAALRSKIPIKTVLRDDLSIRGAKHTIPVIGIASPLADEQHERSGSVWIFRNVATEKRIDESKTEFVSLASHQLRTPLTIINWYCELLLSRGKHVLKGNLLTYAKQILKGGTRMVSLVNELMTVTKIEEGRISPALQSVDIADAVKNIIDECEPLVRQQGGLIAFRCATKLPRVRIDPTLFSQSLLNIIMNALRYSGPKPCSIDISISRAKKGYCAITIKDEGIGVPDDAQEHIFEKFYRARNAIETQTDGNGLGLYIVKRFVELTGGTLSFESKESVGTTFTITLPFA